MARPLPTVEELRTLLSYDQISGVFRWLVSPNRKIEAGSVAGTIGHDGFRIITLEGRKLRATRLAWLFTHGAWPLKLIVPMNRDKDDTRLSNLRLATKAEAQAHCIMQRRNTLGAKGVSRCGGRFVAKIGKGGQYIHLGVFATVEEANAAYAAKATELFGSFARAG